ncbi:MAG: CbiQ family ECF transporter T component [Arthrobacter sp.]|uniref:CbiQ family ECF transporter T component n=1 Tax=unclassified Arthrobacter TaxID=235627 RepID=UPI002651EBF6|nr:energy-coupling factor transporter transmembrane protein EcfT [Micrococcaceae bacterium]MDN5812914.1 energy-coupling factor transporter transmembrane protein EcfT [Micrococcaceae bacterium]MDN5824427.1 energy-coupling factor transporter transmembrane protein EcfT [Micrococcaceae bacterium]MDN5880083.1 energy-coupling factor transporter transmembrane protein EcfT [Micrococcaceae bacterium]MDN5886756.1 energy-coupling factor transporter transmembrane protein EcfT [Micrococcaceae bacterium]
MRGQALLLGLRIPGTSMVHRAPLWLKYLVLVAAGTAVVFLRSPTTAAALLVVGLLLYAVAGARVLAAWASPLRLLWWIFALLAAYQWWMNGPWTAFMVVGGMFAALQLARLLLLTTDQSDLIDGMAWACSPLRKVGVNPELVALAVGLMLRSIPAVLGCIADVSDAARARGLGRNPIALAGPVVVSAVAFAHQTGDALAARGILEQGLRDEAADVTPTKGVHHRL